MFPIQGRNNRSGPCSQDPSSELNYCRTRNGKSIDDTGSGLAWGATGRLIGKGEFAYLNLNTCIDLYSVARNLHKRPARKRISLAAIASWKLNRNLIHISFACKSKLNVTDIQYILKRIDLAPLLLLLPAMILGSVVGRKDFVYYTTYSLYNL